MKEIVKEITIVWYSKYGYCTFTGEEENARKYMKETFPDMKPNAIDSVIAQAKNHIEVIV